MDVPFVAFRVPGSANAFDAEVHMLSQIELIDRSVHVVKNFGTIA